MTAQAYQDGLQRPAPGARPRAYKTDALVLRAYRMRDADRLATVLTPSLGKLKLTVRGARRLTSKLGGHLDVLNRAHLAIAIGHTFDVVTGAESAESFPGVKADLSRLAEALYLMEFADLLLPEAAPHPHAYGLLLDALRALEAGRNPAAVARHTELGLLGDAGFMPELRSCVMCRRQIEPERHRYAAAMGGVVCDACPAPSSALLPLSVGTLKVLRHFAERGVAEASLLALSVAVHDELEAALGASVRYALEREPNTAGFVERVAHLRERGG